MYVNISVHYIFGILRSFFVRMLLVEAILDAILILEQVPQSSADLICPLQPHMKFCTGERWRSNIHSHLLSFWAHILK